VLCESQSSKRTKMARRRDKGQRGVSSARTKKAQGVLERQQKQNQNQESRLVYHGTAKTKMPSFSSNGNGGGDDEDCQQRSSNAADDSFVGGASLPLHELHVDLSKSTDNYASTQQSHPHQSIEHSFSISWDGDDDEEANEMRHAGTSKLSRDHQHPHAEASRPTNISASVSGRYDSAVCYTISRIASRAAEQEEHSHATSDPSVSNHRSYGSTEALSKGDAVTNTNTPSFAGSSSNATPTTSNVYGNPERNTRSNRNGNERSRLLVPSPAVFDPNLNSTPNRPTATAPSGVTPDNHETKNGSTTVHAQAFVMAIAFACIWSPQNCMAPNLTQMANYFEFSDLDRDTFLGAYIALATGVFSLPVSALIGFIGDIVPSRKSLYAATVFVAGLASWATGLSTTYTSLYVARFICGGCMAGSLPVAFSMLGDFFDVNERNAASAGLTAAMGGGMILGQVLAGMVGPTHGWQYPFYICGTATLLSAGLVALFVTDPVRGGKEAALQEMMKAGRKYDRKLTLAGFFHSLKKNRSNALLIIQGFFTSIPWGIIFVFLNDYLSQECNLSVQAATYLVGVFAVGAAMGGLAGGWCGQFCSTQLSSPGYLPLFMGVSTLLGILPFWGILNGSFLNGPPWLPSFYAVAAGFVANLASCNVRPALINVNLPEARGATLTAANLIVNLARGTGPTMLTSLSAVMGWNRALSFQVLLISNWVITGILLIALSWTYPKDQTWVERELQNFIQHEVEKTPQVTDGTQLSMSKKEEEEALLEGRSQVSSLNTAATANSSVIDLETPTREKNMLSPSSQNMGGDYDFDDAASLMSIEDPQLSFEMSTAKKSFQFMGEAMREIPRFWTPARRWRNNENCDNDVVHAQDESFVSLLDEQEGDMFQPVLESSESEEAALAEAR
jgi:MFS family permease